MAWLPRIHLGVIADARRRQRHRRLGLGLLAVATAVTVPLVLDRSGGDQPAPPVQPSRVVAAHKVFSQSPYMGVSCSVANSTACDDVGLAVWLRRPALAARAEIQGRWFSLDDRQWSGPVRRERRKMFAGFLRHAGLRENFRLPPHWEGQPARTPSVRVRIDYGHGHVVETRLRVGLMAGWG
jgi:hypothetical protein